MAKPNDPIASFVTGQGDLYEQGKNLKRRSYQQGDLAEPAPVQATGKPNSFDPIYSFTQGAKAGMRGMGANVDYFRALGNSLIGDEKAMNDALLDADRKELAASAATDQFAPLEEFLTAPTFTGFLEQIPLAVGQIAPSAFTSIIAAFSGAGVAGVLGNVALKKGGQEMMTRMALKKVADKEFKDIAQKRLKKIPLTKDEEVAEAAIYALMQKQFLKKAKVAGALTGASAQEFPQGAGIAFGNFAEQGMTDPIQAFQSLGIGTAFTAIGVGGEAVVANYFLKKLRSNPEGAFTNSLIGAMTKGAATSSTVEGLTELAQEELSVQQKFAIDEDYTQAMANMDRGQALFTGFVGGGGMGAAGGGGVNIFNRARSMIQTNHENAIEREFNRERYGEMEPGDVYKEPVAWLRGQFEAVFDPNNKKDSVFIDKNSFPELNALLKSDPELAAKINEMFGPGEGETSMGIFLTTNREKAGKFKQTVADNPFNSGALDEVLVDLLDYAHNRRPEDDLVIEVVDDNGTPIWYQTTNVKDKAKVQAQAQEIFGPKANIKERLITEHLDNRRKGLEEDPVIRDMLDDEGQESEARRLELAKLKSDISSRQETQEAKEDILALKFLGARDKLSNFEKRQRRYNYLLREATRNEQGIEGLPEEEQELLREDFRFLNDPSNQPTLAAPEEAGSEDRLQEQAENSPFLLEPKIIEGKFNSVTNEMTEGSLENPMKGPTGNQYYAPNKSDFEVAEFLKQDLISYMPPIPAFADPMQQALDANLYSESLLKLYKEVSSADPNQFFAIVEVNLSETEGFTLKDNKKFAIVKIDMQQGQPINIKGELNSKIKQAAKSEANRVSLFKGKVRKKPQELQESSYWTVTDPQGNTKPINMVVLTVWGRSVLNRQKSGSVTRRGENTLFEGFALAYAELLEAGYSVEYKGKSLDLYQEEMAQNQNRKEYEARQREIVANEELTQDEIIEALQELESTTDFTADRGVIRQEYLQGVVYRENGLPFTLQKLIDLADTKTESIETLDKQIVELNEEMERMIAEQDWGKKGTYASLKERRDALNEERNLAREELAITNAEVEYRDERRAQRDLAQEIAENADSGRVEARKITQADLDLETKENLEAEAREEFELLLENNVGGPELQAANQKLTEAIGAVNQTKALIEQGRKVGDTLETRTKVINEPFDNPNKELVDEVQDDFYEDASRYELGMGERKGKEKTRPYGMGISRNYSDKVPTPPYQPPKKVVDAYQIKTSFSEILGKRLGDKTFIRNAVQLMRDKFKVRRNITVITADETVDFYAANKNSNIENKKLNELVAEQQRQVRENQTFDPETGELVEAPVRGRIISFRDADVIIIDLPEGASQLEKGIAMETFLHELGHVVMEQELLNSLQKQGIQTFPAKLIEQFEKAKAAGVSAQYEGRFGFHEWYADQVAGYLYDSSKKANDGVESYFKRIANKLKSIFDALGKQITARFDLNPVFADYADALVKKYKDANKVNAKKPRSAPISYPEKVDIKNMVEVALPIIEKQAASPQALVNLQKQVDKFLSSDTEIPRMIKKVLYPADNFVASLGKNVRVQDAEGRELYPQGIGVEIARMFYSRSSTGDRTGLLTAKILLVNSEINKLGAILGIEDVSQLTPEAEAILKEAEDNLKSDARLSPKARQVREWLAEFYTRYELDQLGLGVLSNYFPRLLNFPALENSELLRDKLIQLLVTYNEGVTFERPKRYTEGPKAGWIIKKKNKDGKFETVMEEFQMTPKEATNLVNDLLLKAEGQLMEGDENGEIDDADQTTFNLGIAKARAQAFKSIPTSVMRNTLAEDGESLIHPPAIAVRTYVANSIKRSEYQKRGGAERVASLVKWLPEDQKAHAIDAINAIIGRVPNNMSTTMKTINSWGLVSNIITLLAFTVLASLPDIAGPVIKSKEFGTGVGNMRSVLSSYIFEGKYKESQKFARQVGVIGIEAINTMYVNAAELDFMTPKAKKTSEMFFKYTGLEWFTQFTRIFAAGMGKAFLLDHAKRAKAGDVTSKRYLKQMNTSAEQVLAWEKNNYSFAGQGGKNVQLAIGRFVDESIVRPNAAERPIWASDPRFALIWQLKSFFYAYGKNIIGGVMRESKNTYNQTGSLPKGSYPLLLAALTLLPLSMLGLDLRERTKGGLAWILPGIDSTEKNYRRSLDMGAGEYAFEIVDRAGIFGPLGLAFPLFQGGMYGDPFWISPLGPSAEKGLDLMQGDLDFSDLLPIYSQIGGLD